MTFIGYLILGALVYFVAIAIYLKQLRPKKIKLDLRTPLLIQLLLGCFLVMLGVSALIGHYVLGHSKFDWSYIIINSLVATVVFYFGLTPDEKNLNLPD